MTSPKLRVAISGGGIGGLSLAAFICQHSSDVHVDLYETKPEISTIGAGVGIWKRSWQALQDIGVEGEVRKRNLPIPKEGESRGPIFRKADQPSEGIEFHSQVLPYGPLSLPRPLVLELIQSRFTSMCKIHTNKNVVSYEKISGQPVKIHFADGSTAVADVLVGCDGVHSNTRAAMYRQLAKNDPSKGYESFCEPIWSGNVSYRTVIKKSIVQERYPGHPVLSHPRIWCGRNRHTVTSAFGDIVTAICYSGDYDGRGKTFDGPWVTDVSRSEVLSLFEGWEPDLIKIIELMEVPNRWAIHVVEDIPHMVSGHVALLGDAAHAMTPHQGVGGGQAIEDAHLLGRLLAHEKTTADNLTDVLAIYEQFRLPAVHEAAKKSWNNGLLYEFVHPDYPVQEGATAEDLKPLGLAVGETFKWLGDGGCDEDWKKAEELLLHL